MIKKNIIIILLLFLTGCYNYNELNDLGIVIAIGIDKIENEYLVSLEVVNTQKKNDEKNDNEAQFTIYQAKGNTIEQAIKNISYVCPKKIYLSHLEVIIYGKELAQTGIKNTLDYFARNTEIRGDTLMLVAKNDKAADILETITPIDTINAQNIVSLIKTVQNSLGTSVYVTFDDVLANYLSENKEIVMPTIIIEGSGDKDNTSNIKDTSPQTILKISDTAIFKNDKISSFLTNEDTLGYNILTNNINEAIIKYQKKDKYIEVLINKVRTEIVTKNGLDVNISIKVKGNISEVNDDLDIENDKVINEINKKIASKIKEIVTNSLIAINETGSDILGILDNYYKNNNNYYQKIKSNWKKLMPKIKYHIDVKVNLINKGKTLKVIKNEK